MARKYHVPFKPKFTLLFTYNFQTTLPTSLYIPHITTPSSLPTIPPSLIFIANNIIFCFTELANSQLTLEETTNKGVVLALYEALSSHDVVQVQKLLASDLEWWFHGPPSHQFLMQILTGCDPTRSITWVHAWTVTDGVITQVREYFNTSLTVTRFGKSDISSITTLHCPSVWESSLPNRVGKSVPGLVLAL
ncbi:hypothetical protein MTR67_027156 [Solanum verrucosum]|uniref:Wound-induced protein 1 n=1 Tax=Solanum verrucosum TaxID=315347 RepID=A0AAF0TV45_SOLVR|nr:hypothetical protein MTR67_027156 [Solanum verrucosum]